MVILFKSNYIPVIPRLQGGGGPPDRAAFRVEGLKLEIWGVGFKMWGPGLRVCGLGFNGLSFSV